MRIGITGSEGFIGWHLRCFYLTYPKIEIVTANRETFKNNDALRNFVSSVDAIVHLAGVNRATDDEIYSGNIELAQQLINACLAEKATPRILFASSTHANDAKTVYGKSKAEASRIFSQWATDNSAFYTEMVIPHVYGEYGKPNYNSAVATFCHQIALGEKPNIINDGQLELVHVQDLCDFIHQLIVDKHQKQARIRGYSTSVKKVANKLPEFSNSYNNGIVPNINNSFDRSLFNAYRGAIPNDKRVIKPQLHQDNRGWLVETIKVSSGGQCFVSSTKPNITRGNHFHRRKFERFCVIKGKASIKIRKLFTNEIVEYIINDDLPSYIDIPTLHTHNITNIGEDELITLFWSNELFDPENSDTYQENVLIKYEKN